MKKTEAGAHLILAPSGFRFYFIPVLFYSGLYARSAALSRL